MIMIDNADIAPRPRAKIYHVAVRTIGLQVAQGPGQLYPSNESPGLQTLLHRLAAQFRHSIEGARRRSAKSAGASQEG